MDSLILDRLSGQPKFEKIWVLEVEKFILENLSSSTLNISLIAQNFGVSERQFYRRVQKILSLTPNNFIRFLKLETARKYLEVGEFATVSEVSYAVGFSSLSYFSKIFKKTYGKSPSEACK